MVRGHVAFFCQQNAGVWEFLTASLEEMNSKKNREFENFANFGSRVSKDLVYYPRSMSKAGLWSCKLTHPDPKLFLNRQFCFSRSEVNALTHVLYLLRKERQTCPLMLLIFSFSTSSVESDAFE